MAIIRMGSVVGGISGRVGGVVFAGGRSGVVAKAVGRRVGGQTPRATLSKSVPSAVAGAWNALTDAQRNAWRTAAASVTRTNRLGVGRQLSGYQLYWSVVATRYGASPPAAFLPPANLLEVRPAWVNGSFWSGGPYVVYSYGDPWPSTAVQRYVYVHRMRGASQVGGFDRPIRVAVGAKASLGEDVYAAVVASGVNLLPGERIGLASRWQIGTGVVGGKVWVPMTMDQAGAVIEDWETGDLPQYTGDTTYASLVTSPVHGGQSALRLGGTLGAAGTKRIVAVNGIRGVPVRGLITDGWIRATAGVSNPTMCFGVGDINNYYFVTVWFAGVTGSIWKRVAGVESVLATGGCAGMVVDTWYRYRIAWSSSGAITFSVFNVAGGLIGSMGATDNSFTSGGIGYTITWGGAGTGYMYADDWTVAGKV